MSKPIVGPWSVRKGITESPHYHTYTVEPHVCEVFYQNEVGEATARFIAAAPQMLEALKELALSQNRAFLTPRLAKLIDDAIRSAQD